MATGYDASGCPAAGKRLRKKASNGETDRMRSKAWAAFAAGCLVASGALAQQAQVNVICSVQADWCNLIQTV
jgi:hypothetical protein